MDGAQQTPELACLRCIISSIQIRRSRPPSLVPNPFPWLGFRERRRLRRRRGYGVPGRASSSSTVPLAMIQRISLYGQSLDTRMKSTKGEGQEDRGSRQLQLPKEKHAYEWQGSELCPFRKKTFSRRLANCYLLHPRVIHYFRLLLLGCRK